MRKLKEINTGEELYQYLRDKADNHRWLKCYGSKYKIEAIVNESSILLFDGREWNDKNDIIEDTYNCRYAMCFSFSKSENVAMWMLYAGKKDDLMINFSPSVIRRIVSDKQCIELGHWDSLKKYSALNTIEPDKYEIELIDIIYCDGVSNQTSIKHSDERLDGFSRKIIQQQTYYKKNYPWCYENECRLIVTIKKEDVPENANVVKIKLNNLDNKYYTIYHNPQKMSEYKHSKSTLKGELSWDLCKNCESKQF